MKSFLILLSEKQHHLLNEKLLQDHISFLKSLRKKGILPVCGPFSDNQRGMLVIRAESQSHAEELINADPYVKGCYYKKMAIHEFTEANDENNWLADSKQTRNNINQEK